MQSSLLNSTLEDMNLSEIPHFKLLLKQLVTMEVIMWTTLWNMFKDEFENEKNMFGGSLGEKAAEDLRFRVIEHNIHVVSKYYSWVVQAMVQQAMQYIDKTPDLDSKVELIQTLNNVFAGKIYVEIERARLIKKLAKIKEEQGKIAEAEFLSLLPPIYS